MKLYIFTIDEHCPSPHTTGGMPLDREAAVENGQTSRLRTFLSRHRMSFTNLLLLLLLSLAGGYGVIPATASVVRKPALTAKESAITQSGHWPAHWIGVAVENIPPVYGALLGLTPRQGLLVVGVVPGSPAYIAELRPGDLLDTLNAQPLRSPSQLVRVANAHHGTHALACKLDFIRQGVHHAVVITPKTRPVFSPRPPFANPTTFALTSEQVNGAPSPQTERIVPGPGVLLHLQGNAGESSQLPRMFSVDKWTLKNGRIRTMQITTQGKVYQVDLEHLNKMPLRIAMLAKIFLRLHEPNGSPVRAVAGPFSASPRTAPLSPTQFEVQTLQRIIGMMTENLHQLQFFRQQFATAPLAIRPSNVPTIDGTPLTPQADRDFRLKLIDAQIRGLQAQICRLQKDMASMNRKKQFSAKTKPYKPESKMGVN